MFEPALLEEISHEEIEHAEQHPDVVAQRATEKLRQEAAKASVPPEIIIELSPELAADREERRRGLEADRRAREARIRTSLDLRRTSPRLKQVTP